MAISNQVVGGHREPRVRSCGHDCNDNVTPTSPNCLSSSSHAPKKQTLVPLVSSNNTSITNSDTSPALTHHLKIPVGDGPYVHAKQVQLVERDPERAIALFWAAINAGDRVDSALKDMAVVMKQQNRGEEAIQAILSFRHLCSTLAQESLDNVLLDLYKKCGRLDDQIELLKHKLSLIHKGMVFNGKRTKTARSQGRKFQISVRQEATRLLGNLGWAYMQLCNYVAAESVYRKALTIDADNNKLCNLGVCLLKQCKYEEARVVLEGVTPVSPDRRLKSGSHLKSYERSRALLQELAAAQAANPTTSHNSSTELGSLTDDQDKDEQSLITPEEFDMWTHWKLWEAPRPPSNPASIATEISSNPAEFCANPALQYPKISSTLDPVMQEPYKKSNDMIKPYNTDDFKPIYLPAFACNHVDGVLAGAGVGVGSGVISPTTHKHAGSFKREIGPSSTREQSKANKNTHEDDENGGVFINFAPDNNYINIMDKGWLDKDWADPPAMKKKEPVARRLSLDGLLPDERICNEIAHAHTIEHSMDTGSCRDAFDVIDHEDLQMDLCSNMDPSFNGGGAQGDTISRTRILDFSCVDKVIESIVPDAPSASQAIFNINADISNSEAQGIRHHIDQSDKYKRRGTAAQPALAQGQVRGQSMESLMEIHQHRLKVFQEMTHVASSCALNI